MVLKIYYDNYTKILHIGKVMIGLGHSFRFYHTRVDAGHAHYFRIGTMAIRI